MSIKILSNEKIDGLLNECLLILKVSNFDFDVREITELLQVLGPVSLCMPEFKSQWKLLLHQLRGWD
jgi:hypothetical protein